MCYDKRPTYRAAINVAGDLVRRGDKLSVEGANTIKRLLDVLDGIREIAEGDIQNDPGYGSNIWQIEADARAAHEGTRKS